MINNDIECEIEIVLVGYAREREALILNDFIDLNKYFSMFL